MDRKKLLEWAAIPLIFLAVWLGMKWYQTPGKSNGAEAPNFTAYLPSGDSIQLTDFRGKIVLLDFWGSWCGPCRKSNRELVELYHTYHNKTFKNAAGFEVISVGVETKKENWLRAIKADKLVWPYHVSDIKRFDDHVAKLYGIWNIPATFLIDEKGIIIGVNLTKKKMADLLDQKVASTS